MTFREALMIITDDYTKGMRLPIWGKGLYLYVNPVLPDSIRWSTDAANRFGINITVKEIKARSWEVIDL